MMALKASKLIRKFGSWVVKYRQDIAIASSIIFVSLYFNTVIEG